MPCYDERDSPSYKDAQKAVVQHKLDTVTEALCTMCAEIEVLLPDFIPQRPSLHQWWTAHKEWDERLRDIVARAENGGDLTDEEKNIIISLA